MKTIQAIPSTQQVISGQTWIGGPTYEQQKQHVPGYRGHVRGLKAEIQHGKTFAKITAECMENRLPRCNGSEERERFQTNYKLEFQGPNLRKPQLQTAGERLFDEGKKQEMAINDRNYRTYQAAPKSIEDIPPIDRLPVVGYQGFRAVYRHPLKKVVPPEVPQAYVHPFSRMDPSMTTQMLDTYDDFRNQFENKKPPVVGYAGFVKSIRAENLYGESFKDTCTKVLNS